MGKMATAAGDAEDDWMRMRRQRLEDDAEEAGDAAVSLVQEKEKAGATSGNHLPRCMLDSPHRSTEQVRANRCSSPSIREQSVLVMFNRLSIPLFSFCRYVFRGCARGIKCPY
jgi:hypothetical protein